MATQDALRSHDGAGLAQQDRRRIATDYRVGHGGYAEVLHPGRWMKCYLCGRFCDKAADGLCPECIQRMNDNNQRVHILGLLKQAAQFCPVRLREEIEKVIMPNVKLDP
jgi:hypothetical protein